MSIYADSDFQDFARISVVFAISSPTMLACAELVFIAAHQKWKSDGPMAKGKKMIKSEKVWMVLAIPSGSRHSLYAVCVRLYNRVCIWVMNLIIINKYEQNRLSYVPSTVGQNTVIPHHWKFWLTTATRIWNTVWVWGCKRACGSRFTQSRHDNPKPRCVPFPSITAPGVRWGGSKKPSEFRKSGNGIVCTVVKNQFSCLSLVFKCCSPGPWLLWAPW